jgi:hypothetical protein
MVSTGSDTTMVRMNKSLLLPRSASAHWEPKIPFDLVIAYEDRPTRDRAMLLCDRIAQQLRDDYDFQCAWWKLDHLREPRLLEQAVDDAMQANMIIVSVHAGDVFLPAALAWMHAWAPNKVGNKSALVALVSRLSEPHALPTGRQVHLQRTARQARMDFFVHAVEDPVTALQPMLKTEDPLSMTPFLENILQTPHPAARL